MGFSTVSTRPRTTRTRRAISALAGILVLLASAAWAEEITPVSPLEGVNLGLPAQEAFRGWPPDSLIEHGYWLPWGIPAFQRAALFDRPVLFVLDVRWNLAALRMRFGTLADAEVLRAINGDFLTVWVDADLRPDLRERYQTGTWPMIAYLMPDGNPMLTGADDPTDLGRPITIRQVGPSGMLTLLEEGAWYYAIYRDQLAENGRIWAEREGAEDPVLGEVTRQTSDALALWLRGNYDQENGGFGLAPKYLVAGLTEYALLREARGEIGLRDLALDTLDKLIASPLYDAREGGVHRLASAPDWGKIEYEKLLDRNGNLMRELVVAIRAGDSPGRRAALRQTANYLTSVLARPQGGFWLAQAADFRSDAGGAYWREPAGEVEPPPVVRLALSGTNALAGAALLRAGVVLDDAALAEAGRTALDLVAESVDTGRGVRHVLGGPDGGRRFLESQGDAALWLLDGYESTGDPDYVARAREIVDFARYNLSDPGEARLRDHLRNAVAIGLMAKSRYPVRPNVSIARAMIRLTALGYGEDYRTLARNILSNYAGNLAAFGANGTVIGLAVEEAIADPLIITIEGDADAPDAVALRRAALELAWPWKILATDTQAEKGGVRLTLGDRTMHADSPERMRLAVVELTGSSGRKDAR